MVLPSCVAVSHAKAGGGGKKIINKAGGGELAPGIGMPIPVETQECIPSEYLASKERNVEVSPLCPAGFPFPFVYCPHLIPPSSTVRSLRPKLTLCFAVSSSRINSSGTQDLVPA